MNQRPQVSETAVSVTSPAGNTSEGVVALPNEWSSARVLTFAHRDLRDCLPESDEWSWRLIREDHERVDHSHAGEGAPESSYRFVLHAAGHMLETNPISIPAAAAESESFGRDPHYGTSQHYRQASPTKGNGANPDSEEVEG